MGSENIALKKKLMKDPINHLKGKNEINSLQLKLEKKLKADELRMNLSLEWNIFLEQDLVMAKEELNKSLKCTTSSRVLNNLTI